MLYLGLFLQRSSYSPRHSIDCLRSQYLRIRFHLGTSKAPIAWISSWRSSGGSHSSGSGLKLSLRARRWALIEPRRPSGPASSAPGTHWKVSRERTAFIDMLPSSPMCRPSCWWYCEYGLWCSRSAEGDCVRRKWKPPPLPYVGGVPAIAGDWEPAAEEGVLNGDGVW